MARKSLTKTLRTVCPFCVCSCGLLAHVTDGIVTKVQPAKDFPDPSAWRACAKGLATPQFVYHSDRLRYPLKRVGERGEGKWERVSWEEALDDMATKLQEIARRHGSNSIAWGTGEFSGSHRAGGYSRLISLTNGMRVNSVGMGDAAGPCADMAMFGSWMGESHLSRVGNPRIVIVWGYNTSFTNGLRMKAILDAKKKGCKVVVIDPRFTPTARRGDEYISIRPGTDGALALGMIHVILDQGLQDDLFITENTVGPLLVRSDNGLLLRESDVVQGVSQQRYMVFDKAVGRAQPRDTPGIKPVITGRHSISGIDCQPAYQLLADLVEEYTPEIASEITDIHADVIRRLATGYATQKPASIHRGWGMQRTFHGDLSCRAINTLAAITGNLNLRSNFALNDGSFKFPGGPYKEIPVMMLYDAIEMGKPQTIKALWIAGHNYLNQLPNMDRIINRVLPNLELIVVCDFFMTTTAKYADYVLPVASFYEYVSLYATYVPYAENTYLQLQQKLIEPVHESKSDFQIAAELGERMGFGEYFDKTEEEYVKELLECCHSTMDRINLEKLREGPVKAKPLESQVEWKTPTGKIEFYVERLKQFGQELPIYFEPVESARSEKAKTYPLTLLSTHPKNMKNSTLANIPSLLKLDSEPRIEINPADAGPRNISDGDVIQVFNDRGQLNVKANLTEDIKPGVVNITGGWWPKQYIEGHINQLTYETINPAQQFIFQPNAAFFDVLVEVKKA